MMKSSKWLLAASAGLLLAACGPGESAAEESAVDTGNETGERQTLVVWEDIEKSEGIEEAVAAFEKEHDVDVEVVEKAYASQIEDLRLDGPGGTGPDVLTMPGDQIGTAVVEGLLAPLSITDDVQSIYTDVAMDSQKVDGTVYGRILLTEGILISGDLRIDALQRQFLRGDLRLGLIDGDGVVAGI